MLRSLIASLAGAALLSVAGAAQSAILIYTADMNGATEVPSNASTAFGFTELMVDTTADTLQVDITYSGLTGGPPAAAHYDDHARCHSGIAAGGTLPRYWFGLTAALRDRHRRRADWCLAAEYLLAADAVRVVRG